MGWLNFEKIYNDCKKEVGGKITIKISYFSDKFKKNVDFGGVLIYQRKGKCKWFNEKGALKGHRGRSIYCIIMETTDWEFDSHADGAHFCKAPGQMHPSAIRHHMALEKGDQIDDIFGVGFAYYEGELRFNSIWMNSGIYCGSKTKYKSDGDKIASELEQKLIKHIFEEWKKRGNHIIIEIPDKLDKELSGGGDKANDDEKDNNDEDEK